MGWRSARSDLPENRRLVLVVLADGTKEILSWEGGTRSWVDQHGLERPELVPYMWHELPEVPPAPPLSAARRPPPAVHILRYGQPMCDFTDELPGSWPDGHRFVSFEDEDLLREVDCEDCRISYGYPECSACRTTRGEASSSRVDRGSGGRDMLKPCVGCGSPTPWRTLGTTTRPWDSPWVSRQETGGGRRAAGRGGSL